MPLRPARLRQMNECFRRWAAAAAARGDENERADCEKWMRITAWLTALRQGQGA